MSRMVLIALVVVCCAAYGATLSCYTCNSVTNGNCADPFKKDGVAVADCGGSCMKVATSAASIASVTRACSAAKQDNKCDTVTVGPSTSTTCYCNSDSCNSAGKPAAASAVLLGVTAMFLRF